MRDRSKQLLVINTGKKQSEQTGMTSQSGTTHIIGGGGLSVNMSDYLLKSIWDKVFEIRTDSQGIEYIFGKLPVVTQYGITMYSGDGVDIPSLASGLPFDGRTIWYNPDTNQIEVIGGTGGGSGEGVSNFWDLSGIPSWITNSKPKYTYSEIEGTPDLTKYALISQIPSLSGYATESWVLQKNYATKATTLSGYGITDAYTKTNVDDLLKSYVTLGGTQTITGEKNFVGGLKVNGSPIFYDSTKKYWKLEGDLLITGGVTMYGSDSSFTPSTIMDAIAVDGTTISKDGGVLKVIGGTGGGVADSVAWANITGKPTWIGSSKPTYSYSEITGAISTTELQNYLTQNSYMNVTSGDNRYLKLSGGTITNNLAVPLTINANNDGQVGLFLQLKENNKTYVGWDSSRGTCLYEFASDSSLNILNGIPRFNTNTIWHSGNDGSGSGLDADLLDGKHLSDIIRYEGLNNNGNNAASAQTITYWGEGNCGHGSTYGTSLNIQGAGSWNHRIDFRTDGILDYYQGINTGDMTHIGAIAFTSSNVSSATKLQTARTIWGQSFDGTGDIEGAFRLIFPNIPGDAHVVHSALKYKENPYGLLTRIYNDGAVSLQVQRESNVNEVFTLLLNPHGGNVGIGTPNPIQKVHILSSGYQVMCLESNGYTESSIAYKNKNGNMWVAGIVDNDFFIWSQTASNLRFRLNTSGDGLFYGGVTMYSDQRKKTILSHVELSLKDIANAPLIEHYYNSDEKKTTHVGSIAQYWASINDWFCKLDSEGFYTMEIQNAALASAISIARELDRYETKTDKAIKKLKKRICELETEVERLKRA